MLCKILTLTVTFLLTVSSYCYPQLMGIGYGKTKDEAKKEALADLSATVKVQVYSKYEQQSYVKNNNIHKSDSSKFTRIVSNMPFINPEITYDKEKGQIKATAVINNPKAYQDKVANLAEDINNYTDFPENASNSIIYSRLEKAIPLYDEYDNYETILNVLGIYDYKKPNISHDKAMAMLLDMQSITPDLEIAAEVLAQPMKSKSGIYVFPPLYSGSDEATPFGVFFKDILSSKLKSVGNQRIASYFTECVYAFSDNYMVMSCSLLTGAGATVASSMVKIPQHLLKDIPSMPESNNLHSIINGNTPSKPQLKTALKISSENGTSILKRGEVFTILVKTDKPAYIYLAGYTKTSQINSATLIPLNSKGDFIIPITKKQTNKWVSLGRFQAPPSTGTETLQVFALDYKPQMQEILPKDGINKSGHMETTAEKGAQDLMNMFSRLKGEKSVSTVTLTIVGKEQ